MERGDVIRQSAGRLGGAREAAGHRGRGRVLILSNGHGEDAMGAKLGVELMRRGAEVRALPIVGEGAAYRAVDVPLAREGRALPSGGFAWRSSARAVFGDFRAGFWTEWRGQREALRREAADCSLLIGVGDSVLVGMVARVQERPPFLFLPTAKSVYNSRFYAFERRWMRRHCRAIYARDEETASNLREAGLPAKFVGNLMMDLLEPKGAWPPEAPPESGAPAPGVRRVALLPGSREEAYDNLELMLPVVEAVERARPGATDFAVALSGGLEDERLEEVIQVAGWRVRGTCWEGPRPVAEAPGPESSGGGAPGSESAERRAGGARLYPVRGAFPDVLRWAEVVLGMAGTASEQAVGLGRPVVSFAGRGPQFTERFADGQRRLLGESISVVPRRDGDPGPVAPPERVAREILSILDDGARRAHMATVGRARMGEPGGAARVAEEALRLLG